MKETPNYQQLYEQTKRELEQLRLANDELSKLACTIHHWTFADNLQAPAQTVNRLSKYCTKFQKIYIYGAGIKASRAVQALGDLAFEAFVISDGNSKDDTKDNHPVLYFSDAKEELAKEGTVLVVALNPKNTQAILPSLAQADLNAIYFME